MAELVYDNTGRLLFTKEMKEEYTILMPQMLPIHFGMFKKMLQLEGYHVEQLNNQGRAVVDEGLKYVHNDTCYPALLVIGQFIDAIKSGKLRPPQGGAVHHPDRRRLPCQQLHPPAPQGPQEGGHGATSPSSPSSFRSGEKPRLLPDHSADPQG